MSDDSAAPAAPVCVQLRVELRPETATQRWHVVVRDQDGRVAFEADTPLELARRLARWTLPHAHGLR